MSNTSSANKNIASADILKFIMSVLVVATHTSLFAPYLTPLVRLAVPVFFMLSGYFFFSKVNCLGLYAQKKAYLKKSVTHNLKLYAFWFIALSPVTFYIRDYFSSGALSGGARLIKDFFLASTFQSSWYITALVFGLIFIFFLSQKMGNTALIIIGIIFYIPALLSSNYRFVAETGESAEILYTAFTDIFSLPCRNSFVSLIYLSLGKSLAEKGERPFKKKDGFLCLLFFVLLVFEYLALRFGRVQIKDTDCFIMLPACAYYICKAALPLNVSCSLSGVLRKVSTISYCVHMPVFMIIGKICLTLDIPNFGNIIVFALTLAVTWAVSLIILKLEKYKVFGFLKYSH